MQEKPKLTIDDLISEAKAFCREEADHDNEELFGVTDGKAVGTYAEHKFRDRLQRYEYLRGSSAKGVDLPSDQINTDIKFTSVRQPQSSCPFESATEKVYGIDFNILLFVYDKTDDVGAQTAQLELPHCSFIRSRRTGDFTTTKRLRQMLDDGANKEDIIAYLNDRNVPADEIGLNRLAERILENPPLQGYLTMSNALQWRLQYSHVVGMSESVEGITQIVDTEE
jgi:hypothetical protein